MGNLKTAGLDVDGGTGLQASSKDRIQNLRTKFIQDGSNNWWLLTETRTYPTINNSTEIILNRTHSRIYGGFASNTVSEVKSWGTNPVPGSPDADPAGPYNRACPSAATN